MSNYPIWVSTQSIQAIQIKAERISSNNSRATFDRSRRFVRMIEKVDLETARHIDQIEKEIMINDPLNWFLIGDQARSQVDPNQSHGVEISHTFSPIG